MLKFNEFRKNNLTLYEILDTMISNEILLEDDESGEQVVFKDHNSSQCVYISKHFSDRTHRNWWTSFNDPNFKNFADMACRRLKGLFKTWNDVRHKVKPPNPRIDGVNFSEREEFMFITADLSKAWIVSLRPTYGMGNYCTSFCITTVLNKDADDARNKNKVEGNVLKNHTLSLDNYEFISESITIKGRTVHICYI